MSFHIDEYIEPVSEQVVIPATPYICRPSHSPIRKEAHTRSEFAYNEALLYYDKLKHIVRGNGNLLSCKTMKKLLQARKVYIHYCNEYQANFELPLSE